MNSSKQPPRVSIGLPIYNGENYINDAMESLLAQTYTDFEIVICDNDSTDHTQEICQAYAAVDSRIRYYRNDTNLGAAYNYNRTFELSRGEYFKWAAHDDLCAPTLLEKCVETLDNNPNAVMCYARTILIDGRGSVIEYHDDGYDLRSPYAHERFWQYFRSSAWCHPVFGLIRSQLLAQTGLIGNFGSSDKVLLGELSLVGKCYEYPEHLAYRRIHEQISTVAHEDDEARAAWFDPSGGNAVVAPRWRRLSELARAIQRTDLSAQERALCYRELSKFYLSVDRVRGVTMDLKQSVRALTRSVSELAYRKRDNRS